VAFRGGGLPTFNNLPRRRDCTPCACDFKRGVAHAHNDVCVFSLSLWACLTGLTVDRFSYGFKLSRVFEGPGSFFCVAAPRLHSTYCVTYRNVGLTASRREALSIGLGGASFDLMISLLVRLLH
jgi:hypothetical protein